MSEILLAALDFFLPTVLFLFLAERVPADGINSGYVALAVSSAQGTYTKEVDTGLEGDREGNMVAFAVSALELLEEVLEGKARL